MNRDARNLIDIFRTIAFLISGIRVARVFNCQNKNQWVFYRYNHKRINILLQELAQAVRCVDEYRYMDPLNRISAIKQFVSGLFSKLSSRPEGIVILVLTMLTACTTNVVEYSPDIPHYETAEEYYHEGTKLAQSSDWEGALTHYSEALRLKPEWAEIYLLRGVTLYKKMDAEGAIADFTQAIHYLEEESLPGNQISTDQGDASNEENELVDYDGAPPGSRLATAYHYRALAKSLLNDWDGSIEDFTEAIRLNPDLINAYTSRGVSKVQNGDLEGAIDDFTTTLHLNPLDVYTYMRRGMAKAQIDDVTGALIDFTRVIHLNPENVTAYIKRGNIKSELGNLDGAVADYTAALIRDPSRTNALLKRGFVLVRMDKFEAASDDYDLVIGLTPENAIAYVGRGFTRVNTGDLEGALKDFSKAIEYDPDILLAYFYRGGVYRQLNQLDRAIADYTEVIKLDPGHAGAWQARGLTLSLKGNFSDAIVDFDRSLKLDPDSPDSWFLRAQTKSKQGELESALIDYNEAAKRDPTSVNIYINRGSIKAELGDAPGAIADFSFAIKQEPELSLAHLDRGFYFYVVGDDSGAIEDLRRALELVSRHESRDYQDSMDYLTLWEWLARQRQGQHEIANERVKSHLNSRSQEFSGDWYESLARFLLDEISEGKLINTAEAHKDPKKRIGQRCEAYFYAANKCLLSGDVEKAIILLKKCIATGYREYYEFKGAKIQLQALNVEDTSQTL